MKVVKYEPKNLWNPFTDIRDLRDDVDRVFNGFFGHLIEPDTTEAWYPAVDIYEEKDNFVIKADLPGIKQEDIKVSLNNNTLTLKGERKVETEEKHKGYYRTERSYGEFYRAFQLPAEVDSEKIKAKYKDGILEIDVPKSEKAKPKEISIKVE